MKRRVLGIAVAALTVWNLTLIPANADPAPLADADISSLADFWDAVGVSENTKAALLAKAERGEAPLSLNPDVAPTDVERKLVGVFERTTETFADGSVRVADLQVKPGVVENPGDFRSVQAADGLHAEVGAYRSAGIGSCSVKSGSGYYNADNCLVRGGTSAVSNFFYASYSIYPGPSNDVLRSTKNPGKTCVLFYTCSIPTRSQYVAKETPSTKAGATYTGSVEGPLSSRTSYLSIEVGGNRARATWFMP